MAGAEDLKAPLPPTALVTAGVEAGIELTWVPPAYAGTAPLDGYNVYRFYNETRELLATVSADTTVYVDTAILPGTVYIYHVTAFSLEGESLPSNPTAGGEPYPYCPPVLLTPGQPPYVKEDLWNCLWPPPPPV